MESSELLTLMREAKTSCLDCYKLSRARLPEGTVAVSPTREQVMGTALDSLGKVLNNGNGCSNDAREALAICRQCVYDNPQGPLIFEYLRRQMM